MKSGGLMAGKNCVVTSGAHGLGFAIARLLVEQGARVAICGRNPSGEESAEKLRRLHEGCFFVRCDLSDLSQTRAFAQTVLERMGQVDVLVNCVGVNKREPAAEISMETYDMLQNVNLKSAMLLIGAFVPVMIDRGIHGSIVNISSIHSMAPSPVTGAYAATKGGLNAFSRVLALEVGKYGIRSNTLCPGWIATTSIMGELEKRGDSREERYAFLENLNGSAPCISPARAEDIARHVLFLASDMSAYITGATLMDDGGATMQTHYADFPEPENAWEHRRMLYDAILDDMP